MSFLFTSYCLFHSGGFCLVININVSVELFVCVVAQKIKGAFESENVTPDCKFSLSVFVERRINRMFPALVSK